MTRLFLALFIVVSFGSLADVIDNASESVFLYVPSTNKLKKEDGTIISSSTLHSMLTTPLEFNPGPIGSFGSAYWGLGHTIDRPIIAIPMTKSGSDDTFLMKVKLYSVSNRVQLSPYYSVPGTMQGTKYVSGHTANTGFCVGDSSYYSTPGKTNGTRTYYTNSDWDESAVACKGIGFRRRLKSGTFLTDTNFVTNSSHNIFEYYVKVETPNGIPEPGTYKGMGQISWRTKFYPAYNLSNPQRNTVNFNLTIVVEPEYHRVEAPSEVKFSKSSDPNHRETSFYADVYGIFSPQMMVTATSANSSGTDFKMNCNECPASYPGILDIQDITYEVDATIEGTSNTFSLQSGVTSTIDLARDSNGFYAGNGVAKVKFDIGYDRSDSTTTVATDLNYEDTLTLVFEPVI